MLSKSLVIRLDGTFDLAAAGEIQRAFAEASQGSEIYVDLTQVREFHDLAVALLAEAVRQASCPVSVRGLRQHQYRMLRYLGVEPSALDPGLARRSTAISSFDTADREA